MAEPIGEIPVQITGDYSGLQKDLQQAENIAGKAGGDIAGAFNSAATGGLQQFGENISEFIESPLQSAQGAISGLVGELGPLGVAAVAAAGALALVGKEIVGLVLDSGAAAEATSNFADQLNLSFNETRKLSDMADIAGVSVGGLARVSMMLADALEDSEGRGKKVANALKDLGVTATDSGQALLEVLQKLSEIPDATERIAKAHEIMGRSAIQLEPLIKDYANLKSTIEELGGTLSREAVDKLKAADDAADKLGKTWRNFKEQLAVTFSPPVIAGLNLLRSVLTEKSPDIKLMEGLLALVAGTNKVSEATAEATKRSQEYNAELDKSNKFQLTAARDMDKWADIAFKRSEEYNKELDKSNEAGLKAAATAQKHAAAVAKEAEAYRVLQLSFNGVSSKLEAIRGIQFQKDLFPKSWFDEQKELLKNLDKLHTAMDLEQSANQAKASIKSIAAEYKGISDLAEAFKALGSDSSQKLSDNLAQADKNFKALQSDAARYTATANDVAVAWNKVLQAELQIGQEPLKTLTTRLNLEIQLAELTGKDATDQIVRLEQIRQEQQILIDKSTMLGQVYISLRKTFNDAFDALEKGLTDAILNGKNLGEVFVNVAKQIASSILDTIIKGALKPLQDELNKTGGLFDTLSKNITKAIGGIGSFKSASAGIGSGEAPQGSGLPGGTNQVGSDVGSGEVSGSPSSGKSSGSSGSGSGLSNALGIASLGVDIASGIVQGIQGAHLNSLMDKVEKSTRGTLNQLISIQDSLNTYLPQLPHLVDIWAEIMVTNDILRLMGQNGGGLGGGSNNGADPDFAQHLVDAINNNPSNSVVDTSMQDLATSLGAGVQAANDYNMALETTASTAYSLDSAVSSTTDSLMALNDATKQVNGALPGFTDGMDRAVFNSMTQPGQNLSPGGARMNATPYIMPVPVPEGLTGPQGVTQGAMLQHSNASLAYPSIAPVVGTQGVGSGGGAKVGVYVTAVDPTSRSVTQGIITGLEEVGIRTR